MDNLQYLENEAIFIIREAVAQSNNPCLLFSGGKDSIVLFHLIRRAFYPAPLPVVLLHVDTGHNFQETLEFRDNLVAESGAKLHVASVPEAILDSSIKDVPAVVGATRNGLQIPVLLEALRRLKVDLAFGGARRDEEPARAKERIFSHRNQRSQWEPKNQRPELWNLYNCQHQPGEHLRVFPLSNWTEFDVWLYIKKRDIPLPSLYFAHQRRVFERDGMLYSVLPEVLKTIHETEQELTVRFRTIGDTTCTGAVRSSAGTIDEVLAEVLSTRQTERGATRADDRLRSAAMEERKAEGYF